MILRVLYVQTSEGSMMKTLIEDTYEGKLEIDLAINPGDAIRNSSSTNYGAIFYHRIFNIGGEGLPIARKLKELNPEARFIEMRNGIRGEPEQTIPFADRVILCEYLKISEELDELIASQSA